MSSIVFINNSQENADKDIHAYDGENDEKQRIPIAPIICWYPKTCTKNQPFIKLLSYLCIVSVTNTVHERDKLMT